MSWWVGAARRAAALPAGGVDGAAVARAGAGRCCPVARGVLQVVLGHAQRERGGGLVGLLTDV